MRSGCKKSKCRCGKLRSSLGKAEGVLLCPYITHYPTDLLTFCFNGHFPGGPGLAGTTRMSPFWIWLELRMMEMVLAVELYDSWSYMTCKSQVNSSPPTNQHPALLQAGCPSCRPTNSVRVLEGTLGVLALQAAISGEIGQINEI